MLKFKQRGFKRFGEEALNKVEQELVGKVNLLNGEVLIVLPENVVDTLKLNNETTIVVACVNTLGQYIHKAENGFKELGLHAGKTVYGIAVDMQKTEERSISNGDSRKK